MIEFKNILGKTIRFPHYQDVIIEKYISSGSTYAVYRGRTVANKIVIIKEFLPDCKENSLCYRVENDCICLKDDNHNNIGRYLPAREEAFQKLFKSFLDVNKSISDSLERIVDKDYKLERYIVKQLDCITREPADGEYCHFELFPYEAEDFSKTAKKVSLEKRLLALKHLCLVLDGFHKEHISINDLKPENFIYDEDRGMPLLKFFDFGSARIIDDSGKLENMRIPVPTTPFFGAVEYFHYYNASGTGIFADVYSIGAMLIFLLFMDNEEFLRAMHHMSVSDKDLSLALFETSAEQSNYSKGFLSKARKIVSKCITGSFCADIRKRYIETNGVSAMLQLANDIQTLIEIYESKGVHPEVMRDKAMERFKDFNIDTNLLTDIK